MGCLGCRVFVAFLLKFLNFIQAFIGASMILYAVWMLNHWNSHVRPPPIAPAPNNVDGYNLPAELMSLHSSVGQQLDVPFSNPQTISRADQTQFRKLGQHSFGIVAGADLDAVSLPAPWQQLDVPFSNPQTISRADQTQFRKLGQHSFGIVAGADLDAVSLPAPWFIYTFLGIGIIVCVITCIGHVAAEITNGFCLCCVSCVFNLCGIFSSWCILKKLVSAPKIRKHLLLNKSFIFYRLSLKIFLFILL